MNKQTFNMLIATIDTLEWLFAKLAIPLKDRPALTQEFATILGTNLGKLEMKEIVEKIKRISIKE